MTRRPNCVDCRRPLISKKHRGKVPDGHARHHGRGLCGACHDRRHEAGTLADVERTTWSRDELLAEWELLRSEGYTVHQAEQRLGLAHGSLVTAIWRARRAGVAA